MQVNLVSIHFFITEQNWQNALLQLYCCSSNNRGQSVVSKKREFSQQIQKQWRVKGCFNSSHCYHSTYSTLQSDEYFVVAIFVTKKGTTTYLLKQQQVRLIGHTCFYIYRKYPLGESVTREISPTVKVNKSIKTYNDKSPSNMRYQNYQI